MKKMMILLNLLLLAFVLSGCDSIYQSLDPYNAEGTRLWYQNMYYNSSIDGKYHFTTTQPNEGIELTPFHSFIAITGDLREYSYYAPCDDNPPFLVFGCGYFYDNLEVYFREDVNVETLKLQSAAIYFTDNEGQQHYANLDLDDFTVGDLISEDYLDYPMPELKSNLLVLEKTGWVSFRLSDYSYVCLSVDIICYDGFYYMSSYTSIRYVDYYLDATFDTLGYVKISDKLLNILKTAASLNEVQVD